MIYFVIIKHLNQLLWTCLTNWNCNLISSIFIWQTANNTDKRWAGGQEDLQVIQHPKINKCCCFFLKTPKTKRFQMTQAFPLLKERLQCCIDRCRNSYKLTVASYWSVDKRVWCRSVLPNLYLSPAPRLQSLRRSPDRDNFTLTDDSTPLRVLKRVYWCRL